jgi:hypothetical protein
VLSRGQGVLLVVLSETKECKQGLGLALLLGPMAKQNNEPEHPQVSMPMPMPAMLLRLCQTTSTTRPLPCCALHVTCHALPGERRALRDYTAFHFPNLVFSRIE